ncbi:MAG: hypothetical protein V4616_01535 [Bacteroidota bacterium]
MSTTQVLFLKDKFSAKDELLSSILPGFGFEVLPVHRYVSGEMPSGFSSADLIIADPDFTASREFISMLRASGNRSALPIIFIFDNDRMKELGAIHWLKPSSVLTKPFKIIDLIASLEIARLKYTVENID